MKHLLLPMWALTMCVGSYSLAREKGPVQPKETDPVIEIRAILNLGNYGFHAHKLIDRGAANNDHYFRILQDEKITQLELSRIFDLLGEQSGDRSRFLPYAQRELFSKHIVVRMSAVDLIGHIGAEADAPKVAALLADESGMVQMVAARALARIGTTKELPALEKHMEIAAKGPDPYHHKHLREAYVSWKDRLDRVKAAPKK
jgi:hypothetical protein